MTTERPYLFIGGPYHEQWRLCQPGQQGVLVPSKDMAGAAGWDIYYPGSASLKPVPDFRGRDSYSKVEWGLAKGVSFQFFKWDDWDEDDIQEALGEYIKFILNCEGNVDES